MLHFTGGEIIPRRVLCPWRAHLLASTLPAVARATAACFVRCSWMIGRGLGLLRGAAPAVRYFMFHPADYSRTDGVGVSNCGC